MHGRGSAIRQVNPLDEPGWDAAVGVLTGASFFHGSAWTRVLHGTYGFRPVYLVEGEQGHVRSILPMMEVNSWLTGRRGVSLPFTDACEPLSPPAESFDALFQKVLECANLGRWKYFELRGGRSRFGGVQASESYRGHILTLHADERVLFSGLDSSVRRAVRKAEVSGLRVEFSRDLEAVRDFHRLLCKTRRRHGLPPQPFRFFENIHRHVLAQEQGWVVLARCGPLPVAAAVFFHCGKTAVYKFGASDEAYQHLRGNNLVMWHAIRHYAIQGFATMDFGRTSLANEGLRKFKLSWGTKEHPIDYVRYDRRSARFVVAADKSSGWYNHAFKVLPPFLSQLVGAVLYKHVG